MDNIEKYKRYIKKQEMLGIKTFEFKIDEEKDEVYIIRYIPNNEEERLVIIPDFVGAIDMGAYSNIKQNLKIVSGKLESINFWGYLADKLDVSEVDVSDLVDMSAIFQSCMNLKELDLSNFKTNNVVNMSYTFNLCSKLEKLNIKSFNTSNVTNMVKTFYGCKRLEEIDLSSFNVTNVERMEMMFENCESIKQIDISNFDTRKLKDVQGMFAGCTNLERLDINNFNLSGVGMGSMRGMFRECNKLRVIKTNPSTAKILNKNRVRLELIPNCRIQEV